MPDLFSKLSPAETLYRPGVVTSVGSWLGVSVDGNPVTARFADPLVLAVGDPVLVLLLANGVYGQSEGIVLCRLTGAPRPSTGTVSVVPASSPTISVLGADGVTYTATFAYTSPAVNDVVILSWNAAVPTALAKVTSTAAPPPPPAPVAPPPAVTFGTSYYAASDSSTYTPSFSGWDRWAGGGGNVYQGGAAYGASNFGAWFYGGATSELAGRAINRIQFRLGQRRAVGSYNSPVTVNFYAHNNPTRPGGDVNRITGPFGVTIQPNFSGVIDLPASGPSSFAGALQAGGGISIAGEPYAGFNGRYAQADSGVLTIDWSR